MFKSLVRGFLKKHGFIYLEELHEKLDYSRSVGKRLDEHRETVEAIQEKTTLFEDFWHAPHLATQDDYLMRLYFLRHGMWPDDSDRRQSTGEYVRPRPAVLGQCGLPEYPGN